MGDLALEERRLWSEVDRDIRIGRSPVVRGLGSERSPTQLTSSVVGPFIHSLEYQSSCVSLPSARSSPARLHSPLLHLLPMAS